MHTPFICPKFNIARVAAPSLHYGQNFGGRNALETKTLRLRFIRAW